MGSQKDKKFLKVAKPIIGFREKKLVEEVLDSGMFMQGKFVKIFERWFELYNRKKTVELKSETMFFPTNSTKILNSCKTGSAYVATNSGTSALHLALLSAGVGPGNRVITTPVTFFATIGAIMHCGAKPIFADVNDNAVLDPAMVKDAIDTYEGDIKNIKAILPVHMYGNPCDMHDFQRISEHYGIPLIEDAAQAIGGKYYGNALGTFGDYGCWSFFATKTITTVEGGMVYCKDLLKVPDLRMMRNHGLRGSKDHLFLGYNYRMNELQAAIGCGQMQEFEYLIDNRIKNSKRILTAIRNFDGIRVFDKLLDKLEYSPAYWWCPVILPNKKWVKDFMDHLYKRGIGTRYRYDEPMYRQPAIRELYPDMNLRKSEEYAGKLVGLPNHATLTDEDIDHIINVVESWCNLRGGEL